MKSILKLLFAFLVIGLLYLFFYPIDIEPVAYPPPPNPGMTGAFALNNTLASAEKLLEGIGVGPEAVAAGPDSFLYTGLEDGRILKFSPDGKSSSVFVETGGRPLGMKFDTSGNLIVADIYKGLLSINSQGNVEVLADEVEGTKIFFADDLDIASDGVIYFTDASQRNHDFIKEVWELQPTGRLISYNPNNKQTKIEVPDLMFANGVAVGPNDDYVLVNETFGMVINKYWLKGPNKGKKEIFNNQLPGYPDNITYNDDGIFWLAMPNVRAAKEFEDLYEKPFIRKILLRMPEAVTKGMEPAPRGIVIGLDTDGKVVHNFQDSTANYHTITSVVEWDSTLYLGSLVMESIGKFSLKK